MEGKKISVVIPVVWTVICGQVILVSCNSQNTKASEVENAGVAIGRTKGFEVNHGYTFNLANSPDGSPYSSGWAYVGGRAGPGPVYNAEESTGFLPAGIFSGSAVDFASGSAYVAIFVSVLCSLWYTLVPIFSAWKSKASNKKSIKVANPTTKNNSTMSEEEKKQDFQETGKESKKLSRRRRRRSTEITQYHPYQTDGDLTRLASIVLNAIASGECLQKTICQLGTHVGSSSNGRLAFNLVDTLLPSSVHTNQYFITMKKALKGDESSCDRFVCNYV